MKHNIVLLLLASMMSCICSAQQNTTTLTLWVNSASGLDSPGCGLNHTSPCNSLNFTLTRGIQIAAYQDKLMIYIQNNISQESCVFVDGNLTLSALSIQPENNSSALIISDSAFTIVANQVEFCDIAFASSTLIAYRASFMRVHMNDTILQGVPFNDSTVSLVTIIESNLFNTVSSLQGFGTQYSSFHNSSVVSSDKTTCLAIDSTFSFSSSHSALTGVLCQVIRCNFTHNSAENGAAVFVKESLYAFDSLFNSNQASNRGGAIYSEGYVYLANITIQDNSAKQGGGLFINDAQEGLTHDFICTDSNITLNTAEQGGGIYLNYVSGLVVMTESCAITDNAAALKGGGIYADHANNQLTQVSPTIERNSAVQGGGIYLTHCPAYDVSGTFVDNRASQEGSSLYAINTPNLRIYSVKFITYKEVRSVAIYNSSRMLLEWDDVSFVGDYDAFYCNDCEESLCPAANNCFDCSDTCLAFTSNALCYTSDCFGASTCLSVKNGQTMCKCPSNYDGDLCNHYNPPKPTGGQPLPIWAIVLIVVGGAIILTAVVAAIVILVRARTKRVGYEPVMSNRK